MNGPPTLSPWRRGMRTRHRCWVDSDGVAVSGFAVSLRQNGHTRWWIILAEADGVRVGRELVEGRLGVAMDRADELARARGWLA